MQTFASKKILRLNEKELHFQMKWKAFVHFEGEKKNRVCDAVVVNSEQWTVCALTKTS